MSRELLWTSDWESWKNISVESYQFVLAQAKENGMIGIKGHRSVGGFRVSLYNALPLESVKVLTELMNDFSYRHS